MFSLFHFNVLFLVVTAAHKRRKLSVLVIDQLNFLVGSLSSTQFVSIIYVYCCLKFMLVLSRKVNLV